MRRTGRERVRLPALLGGGALGLLLGFSGCLNPRPEEDPSVRAGGVPSVPDTPLRESCMSNPALPDCAVPIQGGEADTPPADLGVDNEASDPSSNGGEPPAAVPAPPADAGTSAADTTSDAGLPVNPADASAPETG